MLSSLQSGSLVHIIDKTKGLKYSVGEVTTRTEPRIDYNSLPVERSTMQSFFDLTVKVNNEQYDFKHIPSSASTVNYNNGNFIISETKEALIPIVETIYHNQKQIVDNIDNIKQTISDCEDVMKLLNPTYAKDAERDQQIKVLEDKYTDISSKLDKIFNLINK